MNINHAVYSKPTYDVQTLFKSEVFVRISSYQHKNDQNTT